MAAGARPFFHVEVLRLIIREGTRQGELVASPDYQVTGQSYRVEPLAGIQFYPSVVFSMIRNVNASIRRGPGNYVVFLRTETGCSAPPGGQAVDIY